MPRKSEPWYWEQKKCWYVTIGGKRTRLEKTKKESLKLWHKLKSTEEAAKSEEPYLAIEIDKMVSWTRENRTPSTADSYQQHAKHFIDWLKKKKRLKIKCNQLTAEMFEVYLKTVADGRKGGTIRIIKRAYNWSMERGRAKSNPLLSIKPPRAQRRNNYVDKKTFKKMIKGKHQSFIDVMTFIYETGCRPQEAWRALAENVEHKEKRIRIPSESTKRKKKDRLIYCNDRAWEIVISRPEPRKGFLFENSRGNPWNKDSMGNRMSKIKEEIGKRYAPYDLRHSWITNMVKKRLDINLIAKLAGTSVAMIEKHYDHSGEDAEFMLKAVNI